MFVVGVSSTNFSRTSDDVIRDSIRETWPQGSSLEDDESDGDGGVDGLRLEDCWLEGLARRLRDLLSLEDMMSNDLVRVSTVCVVHLCGRMRGYSTMYVCVGLACDWLVERFLCRIIGFASIVPV